MTIALKMQPRGCSGRIHVYLDDPVEGEKIGTIEFGTGDHVAEGVMRMVTGRHAVYFVAEDAHSGWAKNSFTGRQLLDLEAFVFRK